MAHKDRCEAILDKISGIKNPTIVEVGVLRGELSKMLLEKRSDLYIYMVDAWTAVDPNSDYAKTKDSVPKKTQAEMDQFAFQAVQNTKPYADRRMIIEAYSLEAAKMLRGFRFDLVFIDASHAYSDVKNDILAWRPLTNIIGGHDYDWDGVKKAVNEIFSTVSLDRDNTWWHTDGNH